MSKKDNKQVENKKGLIATHKKVDGTKEYMFTKSPSKTVIGRIILIAVLAGMVVLPLVALIVELIKAM